jgi:hypothetical protein
MIGPLLFGNCLQLQAFVREAAELARDIAVPTLALQSFGVRSGISRKQGVRNR